METAGKPTLGFPVGDGARQDAEPLCGFGGAAKRGDDFKNVHADNITSSEMKLSTVASPEVTFLSVVGFNHPAMDDANNIKSLKAIAHRLRATREALELNARQFAGPAGIAENTYSQWESGTNRPSLDGAMSLCALHKLTLDWIYFGDPTGLPHKLALALRQRAA